MTPHDLRVVRIQPASRLYALSYVREPWVEDQSIAIAKYLKRWRRQHHREEMTVLDFIVEPETETRLDLTNRPGWHKVLEVIRRNRRKERISYVLVKSLGWLSPDIWLQECAIADLKMHGVDIIPVKERPFAETYQPRMLIREFMEVWVSYQRSMLAGRLRESRNRSKAATGKHEGKKPYGFYPGESEVVEHIKALRDEGLGVDRIAARLNTENIKPRSGKRWHGSVISSIITGKRPTRRTRRLLICSPS